ARLLAIARRYGISFDAHGVGLLSTERRPWPRHENLIKDLFKIYPEIIGINIHGPEKGDTVTALHRALDLLLAYRPHGGVLLLHAGERDIAGDPTSHEGGQTTVNRYLGEILRRPTRERSNELEVIVAHGAHNDDIRRTRYLLREIRRE